MQTKFYCYILQVVIVIIQKIVDHVKSKSTCTHFTDTCSSKSTYIRIIGLKFSQSFHFMYKTFSKPKS